MMRRILELVILAALCAAGCSSNPPASPAAEDPIDTSLARLTDPSIPRAKFAANSAATDPTKIDIEAMTRQAAIDIENILKNPPRPADTASAPLDTPRQTPVVVAEPYKPQADGAASDAAWAQLMQTRAAPAAAAAAPTDDVVELGKRIATILRLREGALPDPLALAALETLRPGALAELDDAKSAFRAAVGEEDARTFIGARDRVAANPGAAASAAEMVSKNLSKFSAPGALKAAHASLCTRVLGFGRFEPFSSDTFAVGKPIRALVYCEVEGFGHRPVRETDPGAQGQINAVELSQSLTLYLLTSGPESLQAWRSPEKTVIETSRNVRKDFYLVQQIELPAGLSVGRYNLKVQIKDKTSGAVAESMITVNIVADPAIAAAGQ